ncbi:response regulator transcription factor [Halosimplex rubrum]|uniref:Response regulator transcription factor n=1 Tax=Halosimplex rubrum TaxID=869889 RepID=A0A7D5P7V5_9EURY|nr:response regulator transcription factor [Halosimplex rubrum]QLH79582.1 response regulator transcription factor [Halosimplex rubrum]
MPPARHLVVVAGAEPAATDALASALRDDGTVRTAYSADALRESLDEEVDVVLVDAELVDGSIDSLLTDVRAREFDCQVGVSVSDSGRTAVETDTVDAVVRRDPVAVRETVQWLAARARYRAGLEEFYDLAERRAALADEEDALDRLDRQLDRLRHDLAEMFDGLDDTSAFDAALAPEERDLDSRGDGDASADGSNERTERDDT